MPMRLPRHREPRLGDMLGKLTAPPPAVDSGQLRQAQAEAAKLAAEITGENLGMLRVYAEIRESWRVFRNPCSDVATNGRLQIPTLGR